MAMKDAGDLVIGDMFIMAAMLCVVSNVYATDDDEMISFSFYSRENENRLRGRMIIPKTMPFSTY